MPAHRPVPTTANGIASARARNRAERRAAVAVGLFLTLTIIGAPFGVIILTVGLSTAARNEQALKGAEMRLWAIRSQRADAAWMRAARSLR